MSAAEARRIGVIVDADNKTVRLLGYGTYDGDFVPEPNGSPMVENLAKRGKKNPRLTLDNGLVVWGCEVWWHDEAGIKEQVAKLLASGGTVVDVSPEEFQAMRDELSATTAILDATEHGNGEPTRTVPEVGDRVCAILGVDEANQTVILVGYGKYDGKYVSEPLGNREQRERMRFTLDNGLVLYGEEAEIWMPEDKARAANEEAVANGWTVTELSAAEYERMRNEVYEETTQ